MTTAKHRLPAEALSTMHDRAQRALEAHAVVPATFRDAFQEIAASLMATAEKYEVQTVAKLLADTDVVLSGAAGVPKPKALTPTTERAVYHQHRNVLTTLVVAAYLHGPRTSTSAQPTPAQLVAPVAQQRTSHPHRPMADDEIVLARTWALVAAHHSQKRYAATVYTVCDAGARLSELPAARHSDLCGDDEPDAFLAGGTPDRNARFLPLGTFHRSVLERTVDPRSHEDALLLAHPRGRASEAGDFTGAAATRALSAFTAALGLKHADLVPASAARWRVQHTRDTQGLDAAVEIAGTSKAAVESELGITRELKPTTQVKARGSQAAF